MNDWINSVFPVNLKKWDCSTVNHTLLQVRASQRQHGGSLQGGGRSEASDGENQQAISISLSKVSNEIASAKYASQRQFGGSLRGGDHSEASLTRKTGLARTFYIAFLLWRIALGLSYPLNPSYQE